MPEKITLKAAVTRIATPIEIYHNEPEIPKGHVLVVMVNPNGDEKPNTAFTIGEATYNKVYANNPKYKLKKKSEK